jgi:hypothetical protein
MKTAVYRLILALSLGALGGGCDRDEGGGVIRPPGTLGSGCSAEECGVHSDIAKLCADGHASVLDTCVRSSEGMCEWVSSHPCETCPDVECGIRPLVIINCGDGTLSALDTCSREPDGSCRWTASQICGSSP